MWPPGEFTSQQNQGLSGWGEDKVRWGGTLTTVPVWCSLWTDNLSALTIVIPFRTAGRGCKNGRCLSSGPFKVMWAVHMVECVCLVTGFILEAEWEHWGVCGRGWHGREFCRVECMPVGSDHEAIFIFRAWAQWLVSELCWNLTTIEKYASPGPGADR